MAGSTAGNTATAAGKAAARGNHWRLPGGVVVGGIIVGGMVVGGIVVGGMVVGGMVAGGCIVAVYGW